MTESEWLACTDLRLLTSFIVMKHVTSGRALSSRKWKLFKIGCCRQVWQCITDVKCRRAIEVAEMHADGLASEDELVAARSAVPTQRSHARTIGRLAFTVAGGGNITFPTADFTRELAQRHEKTSDAAAMLRQVELMRDLIGNPFRRVELNPSWLAWNDGAIPKMARAIYDARAFDRLPLLADALEEAGCADPYILAHCRGGGEHVRGCWVVDLLLGRS